MSTAPWRTQTCRSRCAHASSKAVLIGTLGPVLTIFFGWWRLDEALAQLAGAALVLAGVWLASRR